MGVFSSVLKRSWNAADDRWYSPLSPASKAGVPVSERESLKWLTLFACVSLVAGDIAKLPFVLMQKNKDGSRERVLGHPLYDILHNAPNPETTSFNWRESKLNHLQLWGNSYDQIVTDQMNNVTGLWPINPEGMSIFRRNGDLFYKWKADSGEEITRRSEHIFHTPGFGFDGLCGLSMINLARESIGLSLAAEEFGANYYSKGTHPAGVLEADAPLGDKKDAFIQNFREQYAGLGKTHSVMYLGGGVKYKPITVPLADAQFLESRRFQDLEICGFYHVPPHKVAIHGANSNRNNLEEENQSYVDTCLSHWAVRLEQSANLKLLRPKERARGMYTKLEFKGLLRGDTEARSNLYQMFLNNGVPLNNVLAIEDMNPVEGGYVGRVPLNMISVNIADEVQSNDEKDKKPLKKETDEEIKAFFRSETRGVIVRDRIIKQYYPLFRQAAQSIVNREGNAIKRRLEQRSTASLKKFLKEFYRTLPDYIKKKFGPTFNSFAEAIRTASGDEIGVEPENIDEFVRDYLERYTERHVESSEGQLLALLDEELGFEKVENRVDEWEEKRPEKISKNETVRLSNAVFQFVAFGAGLGTIWRIRGKETCPYCRSLNGKRVTKGQSFVKNGDELNPDGAKQPMKIRGTKAHAPLHGGCDCYITAG